MRLVCHGPCPGTRTSSQTPPITDGPGLNGRMRAPPRTPAAPANSPTTTQRVPSPPTSNDPRSGLRPVLFDDVEDNALILPRGRRGEDRAQRLRGTTLFADHTTEIFLGD